MPNDETPRIGRDLPPAHLVKQFADGISVKRRLCLGVQHSAKRAFKIASQDMGMRGAGRNAPGLKNAFPRNSQA